MSDSTTQRRITTTPADHNMKYNTLRILRSLIHLLTWVEPSLIPSQSRVVQIQPAGKSRLIPCTRISFFWTSRSKMYNEWISVLVRKMFHSNEREKERERERERGERAKRATIKRRRTLRSSGRLPRDGFGPWWPSRQLQPRGRNLKEVSDYYKFPASHRPSVRHAAETPCTSINRKGNYYVTSGQLDRPKGESVNEREWIVWDECIQSAWKRRYSRWFANHNNACCYVCGFNIVPIFARTCVHWESGRCYQSELLVILR